MLPTLDISQHRRHIVFLRSGRMVTLPPKWPVTRISAAFLLWDVARSNCISTPFVRDREARRGIGR